MSWPAGEAYANITMPACPDCGATVREAHLHPGQPWVVGEEGEPTATLQPCGHRLVGQPARVFRDGIPAMYKAQP